MDVDLLSTLGWMLVFVATLTTLVVVHVAVNSSHSLRTDTEQWAGIPWTQLSPMVNRTLMMIGLTRLCIGTDDDESDHDFLFI